MMSNLYGYSDYNGPGQPVQESDSDDDDPLRSGVWMEGDSLAPPCGTAVEAVHRILEFAAVSSSDVLYDLGCGDGRICLEAVATHECQNCVGIEIEEDLVERGNHLISTALTEAQRQRVQILRQDLRLVLSTLVRKLDATGTEVYKSDTEASDTDSQTVDLTRLPLPTIIILYLLPDAIAELEPQFLTLLRRLPEGFRIVCNTWGLPSAKPVQSTEYREANSGAITSVHLYTQASLES